MKSEDEYEVLLVRTKYLKETLTLTKETIDTAQILFVKYLNINLFGEEEKTKPSTSNNSTDETSPVATTDANPKQEQKEPQEEGDRVKAKKEEKDPNLKAAFKKIASKIHPDKLVRFSDFEKKYKTSLFEKARMAFQKSDYYGIVEIAESLGIDLPPPTEKQIKLMKEKNKEIEKETKTLKNSVVWAWYHAFGEEREKIMDKYIDYLDKNNLRS